MAKNQAKAKQHSEAAVLLFEFHEFEFRETHMKTPVSESLFLTKLQASDLQLYWKRH